MPHATDAVNAINHYQIKHQKVFQKKWVKGLLYSIMFLCLGEFNFGRLTQIYLVFCLSLLFISTKVQRIFAVLSNKITKLNVKNLFVSLTYKNFDF